MPSLESLPVEILLQVYENVSSPADLFALLCTCRIFYRILYSEDATLASASTSTSTLAALSSPLSTSLSARGHAILARVVCNAFHPAALPIVLVIAAVRSYGKLALWELDGVDDKNEESDLQYSREAGSGDDSSSSSSKNTHASCKPANKYPNLQTALRQAHARVQRLPGRRSPEQVMRRDVKVTIAMCRLWSVVEWFVGDYCKSKGTLLGELSTMRKCFKDEDDDDKVILWKRKRVWTRWQEWKRQEQEQEEAKRPVKKKQKIKAELGEADHPEGKSGVERKYLSWNEYGRLQRGFLWFELYRQLYGARRSNKRNGKITFLGCLSFMELAELRSVYNHLLERIEDVSDAREESVCYWLSKSADSRRETDDGAEVAATSNIIAMAAASEAEAQASGVSFQPRHYFDWHQQQRYAQVAQQGLPFCRYFLDRMDARSQTAAMMHCNDYSWDFRLQSVLDDSSKRGVVRVNLVRRNMGSIEMGLHNTDALDVGRPEEVIRPLLWLETRKVSPTSPVLPPERIMLEKSIRSHTWSQLGWFIWDAWRFKTVAWDGNDAASMNFGEADLGKRTSDILTIYDMLAVRRYGRRDLLYRRQQLERNHINYLSEHGLGKYDDGETDIVGVDLLWKLVDPDILRRKYDTVSFEKLLEELDYIYMYH